MQALELFSRSRCWLRHSGMSTISDQFSLPSSLHLFTAFLLAFGLISWSSECVPVACFAGLSRHSRLFTSRHLSLAFSRSIRHSRFRIVFDSYACALGSMLETSASVTRGFNPQCRRVIWDVSFVSFSSRFAFRSAFNFSISTGLFLCPVLCSVFEARLWTSAPPFFFFFGHCLVTDKCVAVQYLRRLYSHCQRAFFTVRG